MSRTWLVRGAVAAVLAVLAAAWVLGIAGLGSSTTAKGKDEADGPKPAEVSTTSDVDPLVVVETTDPQSAADETSPSANPSDEPTSVPDEESSDEPSTVPVKATPTSKPKPKPSSATPKPSPSSQPTPTPTEPAQECTDLVTVVDCILAPITTRP